jgi:hypothetical protein
MGMTLSQVKHRIPPSEYQLWVEKFRRKRIEEKEKVEDYAAAIRLELRMLPYRVWGAWGQRMPPFDLEECYLDYSGAKKEEVADDPCIEVNGKLFTKEEHVQLQYAKAAFGGLSRKNTSPSNGKKVPPRKGTVHGRGKGSR